MSGGDLYFDQTFISLLDFITTPTLRGAIALLDKYVEIIQAHVMQALSLACDVATADACHFSRISSTLEQGILGMLLVYFHGSYSSSCVAGLLLPELVLGLMLLQIKAAPVMVTTKCIQLLAKLTILLDQFNRLSPGVHAMDVEDLAWPTMSRSGQYVHVCVRCAVSVCTHKYVSYILSSLLSQV